MISFPGPPEGQAAGVRPLVAEQLAILAFSAGDGRLRSGPRRYLPAGLAGAVLIDLAIRKCIGIDARGGSAEKARLSVTQPGAGDPLLDGIAARIQAETPRTLAWWIRSLSRSGVQGQVMGRLQASGLATASRGVLSKRVALVYPAARADAAARVRQALAAGPAAAAALWAADPWSAGLTSLAFGCRVLTGVDWLPREQREIARASLRAIRSTDPIGLAVAIAVDRARRSEDAAAAASSMIIISTGG
jgi:Golgi phosphoprotein 3 (GPP34)